MDSYRAVAERRVGTVLGEKYRLDRLVGVGGMGAVYAAENTWTRRRVAIKLMRPELASSDEAARRFVQEAQASARIAHPNIVDVLDVARDPDDGALFIVQEYLAGEDLHARLAREGAMEARAAVELMAPVMRALVAAHASGVLHRDIKPENIVLTTSAGVAGAAAAAGTPSASGEVVPKLIDFGLAKVLGGEAAGSDAQNTQRGSAVGTPVYMSLEQARGDEQLDERADVWSVGAVLYEMLTGRSAYHAQTPAQLVYQLLTRTPRRVEALAPAVPRALADAVHRALEVDRAWRFRTMQAFLDALLAALEPGDSAASDGDHATPTPAAPLDEDFVEGPTAPWVPRAGSTAAAVARPEPAASAATVAPSDRPPPPVSTPSPRVTPRSASRAQRWLSVGALLLIGGASASVGAWLGTARRADQLASARAARTRAAAAGAPLRPAGKPGELGVKRVRVAREAAPLR